MKANASRGDVVIRMGEDKKSMKDYYVRFDHNAIGVLRSELGNDFQSKIADAGMGMDLEVLDRVLAIGLERFHPGEFDSSRIMALSPAVIEVNTAIQLGLNRAFYGSDEVPEVNPPKPERKSLFHILFGTCKKRHIATD